MKLNPLNPEIGMSPSFFIKSFIIPENFCNFVANKIDGYEEMHLQ